MPKADVNGLQMYYEVHGSGTPLVCISPLGGDHASWALQLPDFTAAGYRCLVFDSRDAGQTSDSPAPGYTTAQFADDTVQLMDAAGFDAAHVVGLSMGGMIAQELALTHPARVISLTLCATVAAVDAAMAGTIRGWMAMRPIFSSDEFVRLISPWLFSHRFFAQPEPLAMVLQLTKDAPFPQTAAGFVRQSDALLTHDATSRLSSIRVPTHVIVGTEDILTPPRHSRQLADAIRLSTLTEMEGVAHAANGEAPARFNEVVLGFLRALR